MGSRGTAFNLSIKKGPRKELTVGLGNGAQEGHGIGELHLVPRSLAGVKELQRSADGRVSACCQLDW
jgi:hypothetical protein